MGHGIQGIQGVFYAGTGCFHRRQVIYGLSPNNVKFGERNLEKADGNQIKYPILLPFHVCVCIYLRLLICGRKIRQPRIT